MGAKKKTNEINDGIVQNIVSNLKEISFIVWLLSISKKPDNTVEEDIEIETNEQKILKKIYIIKLAIRLVLLLLTKTNRSPIKIIDKSEETKSLNEKINEIKENEFFKTRILPFLITISENDGTFNTFLENLFYKLQDIMYFFKLYEKNKGDSPACNENTNITDCWKSSTKYTIRLIVFAFICTFSFLTGVINAPLINYFIKMGKFVAYNIFKIQNLIPSFLSIDNIVGSFDKAKDEYSPHIKHIYNLLLESQIVKNIYKITTYETENKQLILHEIITDSMIFLNPRESAWKLNNNAIKKIQQDIYTSISKDSSIILKPISEESSHQDVIQTGGNKSIYADMLYMTNTNNKYKYNTLNNFIDINSLQGIYMLHKYNKFLE